MFGEKSMYGQWELTIDGKGRIFIPKSTCVEKGERLILTKNQDTGTYEIHSLTEYDKIIRQLKDKALNTTNKEERIYYEKRIYEVIKLIIKSSKIDCQGRFLIGKIFEDKNKILCIGAKDYLVLDSMDK